MLLANNTSQRVFWLMPLFYFIFAQKVFAQLYWQHEAAIPAQAVYALAKTENDLFAATANRVYRSADDGGTWMPGGIIHHDDDEVIDLLAANGTLYAAMVVNGCYISTDGGTTWQQHNIGLEGLGAKNLSMLVRRGDSLFAATYGAGIFVKPCEPWWAPWQPYNQNQGWGNVGSIVEGGGTLLAGAGISAKVSRCGPESPQWSEYSFDQFNGIINGFLGGIRQAGIWLGAGMQGLYRSTDDGRSWEKFNPNVGLVSIASFAPWQGTTVALLSKAGGQSYLFSTSDMGDNWVDFQPKLPGSHTAFDLLEHQGQLWCARADGLWRLAAQVSSGEPDAARAAPAPLYPNPNKHGQIIMPLTLAQAAEVKLVWMDLRGKVLQTNFMGLLSEGKHEQVIDIQKFEPGTILCVAYINGQVFTQLIQILK
jgi:photosystem II stability/assembly factor-like uncharacterized protein